MQNWHKRAACYALPTEDALKFFGDSSDPMTPMTQHRWAQTFCRICDVRLECLKFCLDSEDSQQGVWGGMTESQRKRYLSPALSQDGRSDETLILAMKRCDEIVKEPPLQFLPGNAAS